MVGVVESMDRLVFGYQCKRPVGRGASKGVAARVKGERRRRWRKERGEGDAGEREGRGIGKPLGCSFLIEMIT
jgi:hypothetical protein